MNYTVYDHDGNSITDLYDTIDFNVVISDPCEDSSLVAITPPVLPTLNHIIFDPTASVYAAHDPFTVSFTNSPVTNATLCGDISLTGGFNDTTLPVGGDPLSYDSSTRVFTADTDDYTLLDYALGVYNYNVDAEFANYPTATYSSASSTTATAQITFNDPCDNPFTFDQTSA